MDGYLDKVKDYARGELSGVSDAARLAAEETLEDSTVQLKRELKQGTAKLTEAEVPAEQSE